MAPIANWNFLLHAASWLSANMVDDDWSNGPRPPSHATVRASGVSPFRALLVGGGPAVGYGVLSHEVSLAGHLARRLSEVTQSGVHLDVVTAVDLRCRDMPQLMAEVETDRYDLVFLSVGVQDVLDFADVDAWSDDVETVMRRLRGAPEQTLPVFVIGVPPVSHILRIDPLLARAADRRAVQFNERIEALCDTITWATFVPFAPDEETRTPRHRASEAYGRWADLVVSCIAPLIRPLGRSAHPVQHEQARQAALDCLDIIDTPPEEPFDTITRTARRFFGTRGSGISFIDHDRQWFKSTSGMAVPELPRAVGLGNFTIESNDGFTVEDATLDPRLGDSYFVVAAKLRSYAGVPIRDPHGYMVGALCVFDDQPRKFSTIEMVYLRDLAHLVEEQLHSAA